MNPRMEPLYRFGLALLISLLLALTACAPSSVPDGPRLSFHERSHDFGTISFSQPTEYRFNFTNTGNRSLEIGDIRPEPASPGG